MKYATKVKIRRWGISLHKICRIFACVISIPLLIRLFNDKDITCYVIPLVACVYILYFTDETEF